MSLSDPALGVSVSPGTHSCSVAVRLEDTLFGLVFTATALFVQTETGQSSLCAPVPLSAPECGQRKSIERAVEANWDFGEASRSLTASRSCVSAALQEEVQTKKRSSERSPRVVPTTVAPPHAARPQPLAPQAFPSQLSPPSRNYWWRIRRESNTSLCWGPHQFTHPGARADTRPVPSTQTTF